MEGNPAKGHKHAFYLPLDEDGDGRIDHVVVQSADPFDSSEVMALDRLRSVWQPDGRPDVRFVLTSLSAAPPDLKARRWVSATPVVLARHYRESRGPYEVWLAQEIGRECENHGLPRPVEISLIAHRPTEGHAVRWMEFQRSRKGEPTRRGIGAVLTFDVPVSGPFAIGSGCHFGLGIFVPHPD
jgi:CRISPR-associated protein Csb2